MATFNSNGISVEYNDYTPEILEALKNAVDRGLKVIGETAVGYAQDLCPKKTGNLAGSITYEVDGDDVIIGTNVEYGKYVEFGTGIYAENGGRQTPWVYVDGDGKFHLTNGGHPHPFLRPAASEHGEEYRNILADSLENA